MNDFMDKLEARLKELGAYVFQLEGSKGIIAANGNLQCGLMFSGVNLALRNARPIVTVIVYVWNTKREQDFMNTVMDLVRGLRTVAIVESAERTESDEKHYLTMAITMRYGG